MHENLNYQYHYSNWHTEETRPDDIKYYKEYIRSHRLLPKEKDASILEIGCGMGNLLLALKELGFKKTIGIDIDKSQAKSCQSLGLNVESTDAISFLNNASEKYDRIFLLDVLEHMPKPDQVVLLRSIYKALKPDGLLALSVPNALSPLGMFFENIDWTHYCSFSPTSLGFVLKNAKFHDFILRPTHRESAEILKLKKPWIDLYKAEFGFENPILTPSVMAVCFKEKKSFENYDAPDLLTPIKEGHICKKAYNKARSFLSKLKRLIIK